METGTWSVPVRRWKRTPEAAAGPVAREAGSPRAAGLEPAAEIWLDSTPRPGWQNMAIDSVLLEIAEATGGYCWRLYRWDPFCLSFGRHEPALRRYDRAIIESLGLDTVRRPTGGRAVWHARELTYAVAAPIARFGSVRAAYAAIHATLAQAIARLGAVPALAPRRTAPGVGAGACFAAPVGGEIVIEGRKVAGSAQRAGTTAFLQHGSLLLEDDQSVVRAVQVGGEPASAPPEIALAAVLGRAVSFAEAAGAIQAVLPAVPMPHSRVPSILHQAEPHYHRFKSEAWTWAR